MLTQPAAFGQRVAVAIPSAAQICDVAAAIPSAPYDRLHYSPGPRVFLTVAAGAVRVSVTDQAKIDAARVAALDRASRASDALVRAHTAWLNTPMALAELTDPLDVPASTGTGRRITSWSRRSRSHMSYALDCLDYSPLFADPTARVAMLTLTMPGDRTDDHAGWEDLVPTPAAYRYDFELFCQAYVRAWGTPLVCVHKMEFQRRGAPHEHILLAVPAGRSAGADAGFFFREWVSAAWARVVGHPDPIERAKHRLAGTGIDYVEERYRDPRRIAEYFSKHGAFSSKEYQNHMPQLWLDAIDAGAAGARFWGYMGLSYARATVELDQTPTGPVGGWSDLTLGQRLRVLRVAQGFTASVLGSAVGVSAAMVSMLEHDRRSGSDALHARLAEFLGVDVRDGHAHLPNQALSASHRGEAASPWATPASVGRAYARAQVPGPLSDVTRVQRHLKKLSRSLAAARYGGQVVQSVKYACRCHLGKRGIGPHGPACRAQLVSAVHVIVRRGYAVDQATAEILPYRRYQVGYYAGGSGFLSVNDGRVTGDDICRLLGGSSARSRSSYVLVS